MRTKESRVACFAILGLWILSLGSETLAAVVVVSNSSERTVRFSLEGGWTRDLRYSLAPGRLIPVPVPDRVQMTFPAGGSAVTRPLAPNTVYEFVDENGEMALHQVVFGNPVESLWTRPDRQLGPPQPIVVPVKLVAEESQEDRNAWESRMRRQVEAASRLIEVYCGVRFDVVAVSAWKSRDVPRQPRYLTEAFRERVDPAPGRLAIGTAEQYRPVEQVRPNERGREPFYSHLLLPETGKQFTQSDQLDFLVHELGHWLGAVHSREPGSVMRPFKANDRERHAAESTVDAVNALVMNLYADEIRTQGRPTLETIPRNTRDHLYAIYLEMAMRLPSDRDIPRYAEMVREPVLPDFRYVGQWVDGTRLSGAAVGPWNDTKASPKLAGRDLFDSKTPIRWLVDNSVSPVAPDSWVELVGGDCLPGRVVAFRDGTESLRERLPPHLLVVPQQRIDWPEAAARAHVRVVTGWVRRIVWDQVTTEYRPRTVFFADGRQLDFRSARFSGETIQLLREDGIREVPMAEVAELHLAPADPWDAYFEQLAAMAPESSARLLRLETGWGLRATTTTERFQAQSYGPADKSSSWQHLVQPAWSLDAFWLPHDTIRVRQYFQLHEVPLSRIEPSRSRQQSDLGGAWRWQADRNVEGGALECGGAAWPWGFGVHAASELEFPLPPSVRAFRTRFGLDHQAGTGGCVRANVFADSLAGRPLFAGKQVIGSAEVFDTGRLTLDAQKPPRKLILQVDPAHKDRPAGADPLDIRDVFNWLEPIVELDPEKIPDEILQRGRDLVPCWHTWKVAVADAPNVRLANVWDEYGPQPRNYRLMVSASPGPLRLSGKVTPRPYKDRLVLSVSRPPNVPSSKLEVRVEGKPVGVFEVPVRQSVDPPPLVVALAEFHGQMIAIDLIQWSPDEKALVEWRAISLVGRSQVP